MTPQATDTSVQTHLFRERATGAANRGVCRICQNEFSLSVSTGTRVCELCLLNPPLETADPSARDADQERQPLPPEISRLGPYILLEEIGRGGQGVIYRAAHCETNEILAVKTVLPQESASLETLTRFQREAAAGQSLDHPYAMPVREIGCSVEGRPYFSMKLATGGSLHHLGVKYRGRWRQIAELLVKISKAVQHAHNRGILHRDLKPGNILFTEDHEPLVTDFGLAKQFTGSDDLTQSCIVLGTPSYVSPEQAAGRTRDLTAASDIYSLGAILFDLLTGQPPFTGDNLLDVLQQVTHRSPRRPRSLVPTVPDALETICLRCLERQPENRYRSVQGLVDDLENWLHGRKVSSRPGYVRAWQAVRVRLAVWTWIALIAGVAVTLLLLWMAINHPTRSLAGSITIAVAIDDLDQGSFLKQLARQATEDLKRTFSNTAMFQIADREIAPPQVGAEVFDPLAYGRSRHAQLVLAGCVRRAGTEVRLVTRLVRCDTGDVIWHHVDQIREDQAVSSLPTVAQTIIAEIVAKSQGYPRSLVDRLSHSPSPDAQTLFARAREYSARTNRQDLDAAVTFFRRSAEADPQFAMAQAMLGFALWAQADRYGDSDKLPLALSAAHQALAIDSGCAQAHRVIASCYFKNAQYDQAVEEFWNALELNPQSAGICQSLGVCLREMGHPRRAIPWLRRGVQLDCAHGVLHAALGESLALCGSDSEAEATLDMQWSLTGTKPTSKSFCARCERGKKSTERRGSFPRKHVLISLKTGSAPASRLGLNCATDRMWTPSDVSRLCGPRIPTSERGNFMVPSTRRQPSLT